MANDILIIGNGFDIYHGLPTRYGDFLFLAKNWDVFYNKYSRGVLANIEKGTFSVTLDKGMLCEESLEDYANYKNCFEYENIQYLNEHLNTNAWVKYFIDATFNGDSWVDFEEEIFEVLAAVEEFFGILLSNAKTNRADIASNIMDSDIIVKVKRFYGLMEDRNYYSCFGLVNFSEVEPSDLREQKLYLITKMKEELDVLIECLRIYLLEFVEPLECCGYSEQIRNLMDVNLLNFNYTYTYKKVYGNLRNKHHPIHGDCLNGGMVLGISDNSFVDKLEYIYFVKYFQRIQKQTGSFYREWIQKNEMIHNALVDDPHNVYIIGHSLAVSDKGVLEDFFINDWVEKIVIYYHNQKAYENIVINLVEMFGKDFVIEQTGKGRIVFEKLKPAIYK